MSKTTEICDFKRFSKRICQDRCDKRIHDEDKSVERPELKKKRNGQDFELGPSTRLMRLTRKFFLKTSYQKLFNKQQLISITTIFQKT